MKINFYLDQSQSKLNKQGEAQLFVYVRLNNKLIKAFTGHTLRPKDWDRIKQVVRKSKVGSPELNVFLNNVKNDITKLHINLVNDGLIGIHILKAAVKAIFQKKEARNTNSEFFDAYKSFISCQQQRVKERTIAKYNTLLNSLKDYQNSSQTLITFSSISPVFHEEFVSFLRNKPTENSNSKSEIGLLDDTVAKYISNLKTFMQWSYERQLHSNTEFLRFKAIRKPKLDIVTLKAHEFNKILALDLSGNKRLEKIRDLFCFACFTGQRWSDVESFNSNDIKGDRWEFQCKKTNKLMKIPLVGFASGAKKILDRYNNQLPLISQQNFNQYIKEVGKLAEINEEVIIRRSKGIEQIEIRDPKYKFMSSHMARRTAVTLLLENGVPPSTVQKLTGHSDIKTLMKYENTSDEALIYALENVKI